jgi:hypothetical protein
LVSDPQLVDTPKHLLHVDRIAPPPYFQHFASPVNQPS